MVKKRLILSLAALASFLAPTLLQAAGTEMLDLDPLTAAKVAKEKAKAGGTAAASGKGLPADRTVVTGKDDCGVNIGNVDTSKGGVGKPVSTPRDNTVVITGPVINLGKCK